MEKLNGQIDAVIFDWVGTLYQFERRGLFPFSRRVLETLEPRYDLALISKAASDDVETRWEQIEEVKNYFDFIRVDVDKKKSQFIECMLELETIPQRMLVVDDRVDRGIQIGNELGCKTVWIAQGKYSSILPNNETGQPTYKRNSVEDLLEIL